MKTKNLKLNPYRRRTLLWLFLGVFVIATSFAAYSFWPKPEQQTENNQQQTIINQPSPVIHESPEIQPLTVLPAAHDISVPYAAQAPFSNWDVHEESCEEAALYMYKAFFEGTVYPNNRIPEAELDTTFRAMKQWQVTNYGTEPDLTMTALGEFARSYYGYTPTVKKEITTEDIKTAISENYPVLVPVMTHSLQNSMYGPETTYHVLFIKGYDATGVITNDAGVGNGPNHHYTWEILMSAIDAQTAKMNQGRELLYLVK